MRATTNNKPERSGVTLESLLAMLECVTRVGKGYQAKCPSHADKTPSLRVSMGDRGILVKCWYGCSYHEIVSALGLKPQDLFTDALTDRSRAEYRFNSLPEQIKKADTLLWFYEHDMNKGLLDDIDKRKYRDKITELHDLHREQHEMKKEYGFD